MSAADFQANHEQPPTRAGLPVNLAFVVRFRAGDGSSPRPFEGRAEHVLSGQSSAFHSLSELQEFFQRSIHAARGDDPTGFLSQT